MPDIRLHENVLYVDRLPPEYAPVDTVDSIDVRIEEGVRVVNEDTSSRERMDVRDGDSDGTPKSIGLRGGASDAQSDDLAWQVLEQTPMPGGGDVVSG